MSKQQKFKVGDIVEFGGEVYPENCPGGARGKVLYVGDSYAAVGSFASDAGPYFGWMFASEDLDDLELTTATLDTLRPGDVVVDDEGDEYTVGAVLEDIVFLKDQDGHFGFMATVKDLKDDDYTVKGTEAADDTVELTLEDVAKLKGVPVEKIRIKEAE